MVKIHDIKTNNTHPLIVSIELIKQLLTTKNKGHGLFRIYGKGVCMDGCERVRGRGRGRGQQRQQGQNQ